MHKYIKNENVYLLSIVNNNKESHDIVTTDITTAQNFLKELLQTLGITELDYECYENYKDEIYYMTHDTNLIAKIKLISYIRGV